MNVAYILHLPRSILIFAILVRRRNATAKIHCLRGKLRAAGGWPENFPFLYSAESRNPR